MKTGTHAAIVMFAGGLVLAAGLGSVQAAEFGDRVAIDPFRGPAKDRLQGVVENALMNHFYVIPDFSVLESARRQGTGLVIDEDYATVGRDLSVRAFVSAEVQRRAGWRVQVIVRRGDTGAPIGQFVVADRKLSRLERMLARKTPDRVLTLMQGLRRQLSRPIAAPSLPPTAPPPVQAPAIAPPADPRPGDRAARLRLAAAHSENARSHGGGERDEHLDPEPARAQSSAGDEDDAIDDTDEMLADKRTVVAAAASPAAQAGPGMLSLTLDGRVSSRSFTYNQNYSGLPNYRLSGAMSGAVRAVLRPGHLIEPALAPVGLVAALEYGLGVTSRFSDSEEGLETQVRSWAVGASYSLAGERGSLEPGVTYGNHRFVTGAGDTKAPDLDLTLVALGVDGRLTVTPRTGLVMQVAYLHGLDAGRMAQDDRFPRVAVNGMSAEAGLAIGIVAEVEVRATVGIRRFGFDMNAAKDDPLIAGGAIDQTTWAGLGLAYHPRP